jgi:DnaJ-class molecular chaperone
LSTLEISQDASQGEITRAFRALALQFHPDRNSSPGANARFIELKKAYDVLSDPEKRQAYDTAYRLRVKNLGGRDGEPPTIPQKQPIPSQPDPIYIIKPLESACSALIVLGHKETRARRAANRKRHANMLFSSSK